MASRGKKFEEKFKEQWINTVPDSVCYRLYDTTMGYKSIANVGDFLCYKFPLLFIVDCKSKEGNTLPFSDLRQYNLMLGYMGIKGVQTGFMTWFVDHDRILWIPIETMKKISDEGLKSFNINKMSPEEYFYLDIPSKKMRTFLNSNYLSIYNYYKEVL